MTLSNFKKGDIITVTKPRNTKEGPSWNDSEIMPNMEYLTEGTHVVHEVGSFIYVYDERIKQCWSLDPRWCQLAYASDLDKTNPYYKVIHKIKTLEHRRKGAGYAF